MTEKEITLPPSKGLPRKLIVKAGSGRSITAVVYPPSGLAMLAFTTAEIENCRIDTRPSTSACSSLWVGRCAFDLTNKEVEMLAKAFDFPVTKS